MFIENLIAEFNEGSVLLQIYIIFAIVAPFMFLVLYFVMSKRLDNAVNKYGESVRNYIAHVTSERRRKQGKLN